MKIAYLIAPFFGWLVAGSIKFLVNYIKHKHGAWKKIGYGGFPSTHTSIVITTAALIGMREGWNSPFFAIASTIAFIVMLDASSLRRQIGKHAAELNYIRRDDVSRVTLRESIGHKHIEIAGGVFVGYLCALMLHYGLE